MAQNDLFIDLRDLDPMTLKHIHAQANPKTHIPCKYHGKGVTDARTDWRTDITTYYICLLVDKKIPPTFCEHTLSVNNGIPLMIDISS